MTVAEATHMEPTVKVVDYNEAFPIDSKYKMAQETIDAALKAPVGEDGKPHVAVLDMHSVEAAKRVAIAIRTHSQNRKLGLRVSCKANTTVIRVMRQEEDGK